MKLCCAGLLVLAIPLVSSHAAAPALSDPLHEPGWQLTFADEFDRTTLNPIPATAPAREFRWATKNINRRPGDRKKSDCYWASDNVRLDGKGHLEILFTKTPDQNTNGYSYDFAAGMVQTRGPRLDTNDSYFEQKYGRFEIRCTLPTKRGWWNAFWLHHYPETPEGTEIDVMEGAKDWRDVNSALHGGMNDELHAHQRHGTPALYDGNFHTFSVCWLEKSYWFYVDGKLAWQTNTAVSHTAQYLLITGEATSGDVWGGSIANPCTLYGDNAAYPIGSVIDKFLVDYVRVYQRGAKSE